MRKLLYLSALALCVMGCAKVAEESISENTSLPGSIPFTATVTAPVPTKALTEDGDVTRAAWAVGEEMSLLYIPALHHAGTKR